MPRSSWFLRKPIARLIAESQGGEAGQVALHRTLGPLDLVLLGVGAIIGTGIFVLTGVAAVDHAGPAVTASFAVAGVACALAALCYAEFATMLPISGSAYSYSYATLGELAAWVIGWDLILEYALASSAVAVGWSGYARDILAGFGLVIPNAIAAAPGELPGSLLNLPAVAILVVVTALLVIGIRESARANAAIVAVKVFVVLFVIGAGAGFVAPENWRPFAPQGWSGIMAGAATVFFAYIGFDAVTTAAEEARRPERDMTIGILGSLVVCTVLYLAVSAVVTGMSPISEIDRAAPVAVAFRRLGLDFAASLISAGAIAGLTSVLLVMLFGQSRVFFAMSRDGLLPGLFSRVHPRFRTPHLSSLLVGGVVTVVAALVPLRDLVHLVNIGTLFAFVLVSAGVIVMRYTAPDQPRAFRCPWVPWVPLASIAACFYLMGSLPLETWIRFGVWLAVGLVIYRLYGQRHSRVALEARSR
jgi:APA family basic amino acid/polyamine antiporter